MSFPKVPHKPVSGTLKLSVCSPEVTVVEEVDPKAEFKDQPDLADKLNFSLPPGINITKSPCDVVESQRAFGLKRLEELRSKRQNCAACHAATTDNMIDAAESTVHSVCDAYITHGDYHHTKFSHEKDGTILIYFDTRLGNTDKMLGVRFFSGAVEVGYFLKNGLNSEKKFRLAGFNIQPHIEWLLS